MGHAGLLQAPVMPAPAAAADAVVTDQPADLQLVGVTPRPSNRGSLRSQQPLAGRPRNTSTACPPAPLHPRRRTGLRPAARGANHAARVRLMGNPCTARTDPTGDMSTRFSAGEDASVTAQRPTSPCPGSPPPPSWPRWRRHRPGSNGAAAACGRRTRTPAAHRWARSIRQSRHRKCRPDT